MNRFETFTDEELLLIGRCLSVYELANAKKIGDLIAEGKQDDLEVKTLIKDAYTLKTLIEEISEVIKKISNDIDDNQLS